MVDGVSAEKLRITTSLAGPHPLPQSDSSSRIIAGTGHEDRANLIRFQFLGSRKWQTEKQGSSLLRKLTDLLRVAVPSQYRPENSTTYRDGLVSLNPLLGMIEVT